MRVDSADSENLGKEKLGDYMGGANSSSLSLYVGTKASSPLRYIAEQGVQFLAGWVPSLPGIVLRVLLYWPLISPKSSPPLVEGGVEFFHMGNCHFGKSVYIDSGCRIHASNAAISFGDCSRVMRGAYVCSYVSSAQEGEGITTGKRCWIGVGSLLASGRGGISLGDDVLIGPQAIVVTGGHDYERLDIPATQRDYNCKPITIESGAWIGAHATILGGVCVGRNAVVAAGAVVAADVPPNTVVGGVPAKVLRKLTS